MTPGVINAWFVIPPALALMLVVGALQIRISKSDAPPSRKRIRIANGWVMLIAIPLLAAGFSLVNPTLAPRTFLLTWGAAIGMLCIAVALAVLDMVNTWRLTRGARRHVRDAFISLHTPARGRARDDSEAADGG